MITTEFQSCLIANLIPTFHRQSNLYQVQVKLIYGRIVHYSALICPLTIIIPITPILCSCVEVPSEFPEKVLEQFPHTMLTIVSLNFYFTGSCLLQQKRVPNREDAKMIGVQFRVESL